VEHKFREPPLSVRDTYLLRLRRDVRVDGAHQPVWQSRSGDPYTDRINTMPKYVVSTTLKGRGATGSRSMQRSENSSPAHTEFTELEPIPCRRNVRPVDDFWVAGRSYEHVEREDR
jgi:hypothetical protein